MNIFLVKWLKYMLSGSTCSGVNLFWHMCYCVLTKDKCLCMQALYHFNVYCITNHSMHAMCMCVHINNMQSTAIPMHDYFINACHETCSEHETWSDFFVFDGTHTHTKKSHSYVFLYFRRTWVIIWRTKTQAIQFKCVQFWQLIKRQNSFVTGKQ